LIIAGIPSLIIINRSEAQNQEQHLVMFPGVSTAVSPNERYVLMGDLLRFMVTGWQQLDSQ